MGRTVSHLSISLDGFVAGLDQGPEHPYGVGGRQLHEWARHADEPGFEPDRRLWDELLRPMGAYVMGRNMFGPIRGEWTGDWRGWWGEEPPYHAPVFVLTHHPREPIEMAGGTIFNFVTEGFEGALEQARDAAGDADIRIAGGASTVRQALRAGAIDELQLDIVPVLLTRGERLLVDVGKLRCDPVEVVHSPRATHVRYRVTARTSDDPACAASAPERVGER
ncbi:MAG: dihydrofolate reductase family protein [Candidatus Dormibacteria bacterium]